MSCNPTDATRSDPSDQDHRQSATNSSDGLQQLSSGLALENNIRNAIPTPLASRLTFKTTDLAIAKKKVASAIANIKAVDGCLAAIGNIVVQMKELFTTLTSPATDDLNRQFLGIEYQAWHDEIGHTTVAFLESISGRVNSNQEYQESGSLVFDGDNAASSHCTSLAQSPTHSSVQGVSGRCDSIDLGEIDLQWINDLSSGCKDVIGKQNYPRIDDGSNSAQDRNLTGVLAIRLTVVLPSLVRTRPPRNLENGRDGELIDHSWRTEDGSNKKSDSRDQSLDQFGQVLADLAVFRTKLSHLQCNLEDAQDRLATYQENMAAAKSTDADNEFALAVGQLARARILTEAAAALLAQGGLSRRQVSDLALSLIK